MRTPGSETVSLNQVDECSDLGCCLLRQKNANDAAATCECFSSNASCDAEAQARAGSVVVSQCPPPGESPKDSEACIVEGQSCRFGVEGNCCSGTLCRPNAAGVQVCQAASSEDLALAKQCTRVSNSQQNDQFDLVTPTLRTAVGEISLPSVKYSFEGVGPQGCFNAWSLTLGDSSSCSLDLTVKLQGGKLVVTNVLGEFGGCPGATPLPDPTSHPLYGLFTGSNPAIDLTFQGLACEDENLFIEQYCVAGTFDFHISKATLTNTSVEDQHLILQGVSCSSSPMGDCPTP